MLATWVSSPPAGEFHYEIKLDGYRLLARLDGAVVQLHTRNGVDYTGKLGRLAKALANLRRRGTYLDGEIVVFDTAGVSHFGALQDALSRGDETHIRYVVFDLPFAGGRDVRGMSIEVRRALLTDLLTRNRSPLIVPCTWVDGDAAALLEAAREGSYEGLIGKRSGSTYVSGRSNHWIKLTFANRQEGIVVGYTSPKGSRAGLGALLLAVREGQALRYIGKVGTGFSNRTLADLSASLRRLHADEMPLPARPADARGVQWVTPTLVVDVEHAGFTAAGMVRKASFVGIRPDRTTRSVRRSAPVRTLPGDDTMEDVRITNADRVIDAASGATKGDLAQFYRDIAPFLLPHLAHRPVALLRAPDGVGGGTFFQKHADPRVMPGVRLLPAALDPEHPPLLAIDSAHALVSAVQMGTIELHTWNATERRIERPDRLIFDLDPDTALPFDHVRRAATLIRELLGALDLRAFVKTTGGAGLHVIVPLTPREDWEYLKGFARAVANHAARTLPGIFVAKSGPKNRVKRIFVDYLRNGRGSSTVSAFSVRARPGLPVSVPIDWDILEMLDDPASLHIGSVAQWLDEQREDPWADYAHTRQRITRSMLAQLGATPD